MSKRKRYSRSMLLAATLALVATACGEGGAESDTGANLASGCLEADAAIPVKIGIRSSLVFADVYLAEQRGYFDDAGLDVSLEAVDPATALQLVAGGDVDAVATGLTAGLFNAIESGLDLFPVMPGGNDSADTASQFWVRSELVDSSEVKDVSDLEGRKFAMPGIVGAGASQKVGLYLGTGDLSYSDVELVNIDYPDMPGAFANGSIDAAYVTAGASGPIEEARAAQPIGKQQITVDVNTNTIVVGDRLANEEAAVGTAFLRSLMRARDDLQNNYWEDAEVVADLVAATDIDEETIKATARAGFPADLAFTPDSWEGVQNLYTAADVLDYDEVKPFDEVAAPSLREDAITSRDECK